MVEAEVAFIDNLHDILRLIEDLIKNVVQRVLNECEGDIQFIQKENNLNYNLTKILDKSFTVMDYQEIVNILESNSKPGILEHGLAKEQELFLVQHNDNIPIFVINWPKHLKPIYMKESEDCTKVCCLLFFIKGKIIIITIFLFRLWLWICLFLKLGNYVVEVCEKIIYIYFQKSWRNMDYLIR